MDVVPGFRRAVNVSNVSARYCSCSRSVHDGSQVEAEDRFGLADKDEPLVLPRDIDFHEFRFQAHESVHDAVRQVEGESGALPLPTPQAVQIPERVEMSALRAGRRRE